VFYVADPAALAAKVRAAGCEVTHQPTANANMQGSMLCMAKDPDGYTIELIQRPARVSQTQEAVG
jgi:predicted enzyme related to lactoylglutathione lyase